MIQELADVIEGRSTGLRDIQGRELFDGDEVFSLNLHGKDGKPGACATVRLMKWDEESFWTAGGTGIASTCAEPRFGLYRLRGTSEEKLNA